MNRQSSFPAKIYVNTHVKVYNEITQAELIEFIQVDQLSTYI